MTVDARLGIVAGVAGELSEITLRLAGSVGAAGLSRSAGSPGLLAAVDQHAAEVRDSLTDGGRPAVHSLLGYARGFVEAAIGRGWRPGASLLDWESLRLAAVCLLIAEAG
jgi:hypothetical protein